MTPLSHERPNEWFAYQAWDDDWRSSMMDLFATMHHGDERAFAVAALILLAGWQSGYDG